MLDAARAGDHTLLVAATGAGKTLAGFLPTLVDLVQAQNPVRPELVEGLPFTASTQTKQRTGLRQAQPERIKEGLHTLYVSPLKALAAPTGTADESLLIEAEALAAEAMRFD